jgi:hypothetical protein
LITQNKVGKEREGDRNRKQIVGKKKNPINNYIK